MSEWVGIVGGESKMSRRIAICGGEVNDKKGGFGAKKVTATWCHFWRERRGMMRLGRGVEIKSAGHDSVEFTINPQIIYILRIRRRVIRSRLMHYILF